MLLSHKVVKSNQVNETDKNKKIEVLQAAIKADSTLNTLAGNSEEVSVVELKKRESAFFNDVEKMKAFIAEEKETQLKQLDLELSEKKAAHQVALEQEKKIFNQELQELKMKMIQETESEIEILKKDAEQEGFEEGQQAGYQKGYEDGKAIVLQEMDEVRAKSIETMQDVVRKSQEYAIEKKQEWIDLAVTMAQTILETEISQDDTSLFLILKPYLFTLKQQDSYVMVFVNKKNSEKIKHDVLAFKEENPQLKLSIIVDELLADDACQIETTSEIVDLSIKDQLERMKNTLVNEALENV